jgi:hypothetical protein
VDEVPVWVWQIAGIVASEELVLGSSRPYEHIFTALRSKPDQNGADLARGVVDRYVNFYAAKALDLGGIEYLARVIDRRPIAIFRFVLL